MVDVGVRVDDGADQAVASVLAAQRKTRRRDVSTGGQARGADRGHPVSDPTEKDQVAALLIDANRAGPDLKHSDTHHDDNNQRLSTRRLVRASTAGPRLMQCDCRLEPPTLGRRPGVDGVETAGGSDCAWSRAAHHRSPAGAPLVTLRQASVRSLP